MCVAAHFEIPIRHYDKEEKLLPPIFLDYKSMVAHDFIVKNREKALKYKLVFGKNHPETITLPAPCLIYLQASTLFRWRPFTPTGTYSSYRARA